MTARREDQHDDERRLDKDAYPWQFKVKNRFNLERPLGFGVTTNDDGELVAVIVVPDNGYSYIDADTCEQIAFAWRGLCQRLKDEQAKRVQAEKPES